MSGAPQFPDPLGAREVYRPGATQHKAGPDLPRKVLALEQGALARPGPGVANGSVITSDTSQTGGVTWLKRPSARGFLSGAVSIANNDDTVLTFGGETFDNSSMHSTSSNTSRFIGPVAGSYHVCGTVAFAANATGIRSISLYIDGALIQFIAQVQACTGGFATYVPYAADVQLSAGQYIEIYGFQNSGGALNALATDTTCCVSYIGPSS